MSQESIEQNSKYPNSKRLLLNGINILRGLAWKLRDNLDIFELYAQRLREFVHRTSKHPSKQTNAINILSPKKTHYELKIAAIMDKFSATCFKPDCKIVQFSPDNHTSELSEGKKPDILVVESAWSGNDGSWEYKIASYRKNKRQELIRLLHWCNQQGIPTIFWNKEDPVHFNRFLPAADLFENVLTSDAGCIDKYKKILRHSNIFATSFAAQPAFHNPIQSKPREQKACFAGSYLADRNRQRQHDTEILLKPAMEFGLDIFDRNHKKTGLEALRWRFPDIYQPYIRGQLEYEDILQAYKRYRVFLNVNSVTNSPTMFARRVVELLACGTPLISSYAQGIVDVLGQDAVLFSSSEKETKEHLARLLEDEEYWARRSVSGIRCVMDKHTYAHRIEQMCERIGLSIKKTSPPQIAALARIKNIKALDQLTKTITIQTRKPNSLLLLCDFDATDSLQKLRNQIGDTEITWQKTDNAINLPNLESQLKSFPADWVCMLSANCHYGANYLLDYSLADKYCDLGVIGKQTHYCTTNNTKLEIINPSKEFWLVDEVVANSAMVKANKISRSVLEDLLTQKSFSIDGEKCCSLDRFNFINDCNSNDPAVVDV
jgi:spore maturation protein CgeB